MRNGFASTGSFSSSISWRFRNSSTTVSAILSVVILGLWKQPVFFYAILQAASQMFPCSSPRNSGQWIFLELFISFFSSFRAVFSLFRFTVRSSCRTLLPPPACVTCLLSCKHLFCCISRVHQYGAGPRVFITVKAFWYAELTTIMYLSGLMAVSFKSCFFHVTISSYSSQSATFLTLPAVPHPPWSSTS